MEQKNTKKESRKSLNWMFESSDKVTLFFKQNNPIICYIADYMIGGVLVIIPDEVKYARKVFYPYCNIKEIEYFKTEKIGELDEGEFIC